MNPFVGLNYKSMFEWIKKKKNRSIETKIACGGDLSGSDSESSTEDDTNHFTVLNKSN